MFCSIRSNLIKLACWIDVLDHYKLYSIVCVDQLINFLKWTSGSLKFLGFFLLETLCSSQFCDFELNFTALEHAA